MTANLSNQLDLDANPKTGSLLGAIAPHSPIGITPVLHQNLVWNLPSADLNLSSNAVHVWRASLEQPALPIQQLAQTLSEDEQLRAKRFYFERDRKHFIVGRGMLRTILGHYANTEPNQLQFSYGSRGKPALVSTDTDSMLQFNLSHSNGLALYAVTRDRQIGIDLEYIRPISDIEQLSKRFFSPREYSVICSLPKSEQQVTFFKIWTCKEAYLKATGEGLAQLQQVEVSLTDGETCQLNIHRDSQGATYWSLQMLAPATDYVAALAVEGHDWDLSCWQG
jgi:4'-phosphopantetheinyl transferase